MSGVALCKSSGKVSPRKVTFADKQQGLERPKAVLPSFTSCFLPCVLFEWVDAEGSEGRDTGTLGMVRVAGKRETEGKWLIAL